jgi:hypothetical protein
VTQPPSAPPTPTHLAGTGNSFEFEDRGDLIKFYNTIYVQKIQGFALKFSVGGGQVIMHKASFYSDKFDCFVFIFRESFILFVDGLFNGAVSSSDHVVSYHREGNTVFGRIWKEAVV